jgi:phenylpyruvate tautomerase PptA (4-oxalocrotonate tautomerase family)
VTTSSVGSRIMNASRSSTSIFVKEMRLAHFYKPYTMHIFTSQ